METSVMFSTPPKDLENLKTENSESVAQVGKGTPKSLTLYVPTSFDIDKLLEQCEPNFKGYHRDKFIYLVHLINDIPTRRKDEKFMGGFIPLHSSILRRKLGDTYRKHLDYLIQQNVLEEDSQYFVGQKSRGFKFTPAHNTEVKPVEITKKTLIKSILKFTNIDFDKNTIFSNELDVSYLYKWFNPNLSIHFENAQDWLYQEYLKSGGKDNVYLEENAMMTYNKRLIPVYKLERGEFSPTIDKTASRLHSTLTQIKSELRQFITYENKTLVSVDIKNSQPYLSCVLFNKDCFNNGNIGKKLSLFNTTYIDYIDYTNNKSYQYFVYYVSKNWNAKNRAKDVDKYIELVANGVFYEEFGKLLEEEGLVQNVPDLRKYAKNTTFITLFSPNHHSRFCEEIKVFKRIFPSVYRIFSMIKKGKSQHNALACLLQNFEARLVLGIACKKITESYPSAPIFTLHDSIITTQEYLDKVKEVLFETLSNNVGVNPTLQIETWETED